MCRFQSSTPCCTIVRRNSLLASHVARVAVHVVRALHAGGDLDLDVAHCTRSRHDSCTTIVRESWEPLSRTPGHPARVLPCNYSTLTPPQPALALLAASPITHWVSHHHHCYSATSNKTRPTTRRSSRSRMRRRLTPLRWRVQACTESPPTPAQPPYLPSTPDSSHVQYAPAAWHTTPESPRAPAGRLRRRLRVQPCG